MKRHLRFSLKGLLLCVTVICLWLGYRLSAIHREESAVHAIKQANGWVEYGSPRGFHGVIAFGDYRHRPKWKRVLMGNGPYDAVGVVHLGDGISHSNGSSRRNGSSFCTRRRVRGTMLESGGPKKNTARGQRDSEPCEHVRPDRYGTKRSDLTIRRLSWVWLSWREASSRLSCAGL
jgi:hypothetical protein